MYNNNNKVGEHGRTLKKLGIDNKTAYQQANLSNEKELILAMRIYSSIEDKIKLTYYQCGSSLPQRQCHEFKDDPYYSYQNKKDADGNDINFIHQQLSPIVDFFCKYKEKHKKHSIYCQSDEAYYLDDSTRDFWVNRIIPRIKNNILNILKYDFFAVIAQNQNLIDNFFADFPHEAIQGV